VLVLGGELSLLGLDLVRDIVLLGEGRVGLPLGGGSRSRLGKHLVNLLQSKTLGLRDHEVRVDKGASAETSPNEEDGRSEVTPVGVDHVRGDDGDDGVPEPVGGGGQGDTSGSDGQGEDLSDQDPSTGTPSAGKEEDEDGDESDLGVDGRDVSGDKDGVTGGVDTVLDELVESDGNSDDGDEELADHHGTSADDQELSSTKLLDGVERDRGGAHVDNGKDHRDDEWVVDGTGRLEEGSRVVEDKVDTGPLLHHLERGSEDGLSQVGRGVKDGSSETGGPGSEPGGRGHHRPLVLGVGDNLGELGLDQSRVLILTTETSQGVSGSGNVLLLDKVSRRLGEAEETESEDGTPGELDSDGDSVSAVVRSVLGKVDDDGGQHDTDGDGELVSRDQSTSNLSGANFRHVENDDGRDETDTETGNDTTDDDGGETFSSKHLDDDSDEVDGTTGDDGGPSSDHVGGVTGDDGTKEGTGRQDRDDERGLGSTDLFGADTLDSIDEDSGRQDSVDVTRVITEEDTSKRGKGAHEVGLQGDRRLDDGGGPVHGRHDEGESS